jgi:PIN domain nuclease of toxin-antitoxin system
MYWGKSLFRQWQRHPRNLAQGHDKRPLSPVSVWELTILCRKGRLQVHPDISTWVKRSMLDLQLSEAPLTIDVALAIPSISLQHADPADHVLAASAKVFDLTLITADEHLVKLPGIRVLANR